MMRSGKRGCAWTEAVFARDEVCDPRDLLGSADFFRKLRKLINDN